MSLKIQKRNGEEVAFNPQKIYQRIKRSSKGLNVNADEIFIKVITSVPTEGSVTTKELDALVFSIAASYTGSHYDYSKLASSVAISSYHKETSESFCNTMHTLHVEGIINDELMATIEKYGPDKIDACINHENDYNFDYFGWRSLLEMYLLKTPEGVAVERPQHMYMRVALWVTDSFEEAVGYYNSLSKQLISPATPIMINSGTKVPQLASCVLHYNNGDSRRGLLDTLSDISTYSSDAAGIGLCMSNIRSKESRIKTSGGFAGGLLKFLKIVNESLRFFNQQGRRPGSAAIYIEPWHKDIFDLLEIKKNSGIEELRARDLFTALWLPDNFMRAVENDTEWFLFCPNDIIKAGLKPLQECYGDEYEQVYNKAVELGLGKSANPQHIWNKIIESQIETGVPYLASKDNVNKKTNHQNYGILKQSNLCIEIMQYTDELTTAICSLSSLVLKNFVIDAKFDFDLLIDETRRIVRALNNVIDINYYSTEKGRRGGLEQRAIAIGVQGLADVFFLMDYEFTSDESKELNKKIFEAIYYAAVLESNRLCKEGIRKPYNGFKGSPMSKGIMQFDMWDYDENNLFLGIEAWQALKEDIIKYGICNSLFTAAMPVACQTSDTKIRTEYGVLSFREICEMNGIDVDLIESNKVGGVWYNFENEIMVDTMNGLRPSNKILYNGHTEIYELEMEDGTIFKCSSEHMFLTTNDEWKKVSTINEDDIIQNKDGEMKIMSVKKTNNIQPVWDIEVADGNHYITENGCVSHNSSAKITGSFEMIEPAQSALFNRRVVGGEILIVNKYLINDFEKLGIWSEELKNEIIMNDGSIQKVNFNTYLDPEEKNYTKKVARIEHLIRKYKTIWEIPQRELIDMAADRGVFIDQSQSMNIYMATPTLSKISSAHFYSWKKGLKTISYYTRTKAISTGAKHLAIDVSKSNPISQEIKKPLHDIPPLNVDYTHLNLPPKPEGSDFECFGCSS